MQLKKMGETWIGDIGMTSNNRCIAEAWARVADVSYETRSTFHMSRDNFYTQLTGEMMHLH